MFFNYLKMELFRLAKKKSTYILAAVMVVLVFATNAMYLCLDAESIFGVTVASAEMAEDGSDYEQAFDEGVAAGEEEEDVNDIKIFGKGLMYESNVADFYALNTQGRNILLLAIIAVSLFVGDIFVFKTQKNYLNAISKKGVWMSARYACIAIYLLAMTVVQWLTCVLTSALWAKSVDLALDKSFFIYFVTSYLLMYAMVALVASITEMTRNRTAGLVLGIIISQGFFAVLILVVDLILHKLMELPEDFALSNYTLSANLGNLALDTKGSIVMTGVVVAICYTVVAIGLSAFVSSKRDTI